MLSEVLCAVFLLSWYPVRGQGPETGFLPIPQYSEQFETGGKTDKRDVLDGTLYRPTGQEQRFPSPVGFEAASRPVDHVSSLQESSIHPKADKSEDFAHGFPSFFEVTGLQEVPGVPIEFMAKHDDIQSQKFLQLSQDFNIPVHHGSHPSLFERIPKQNNFKIPDFDSPKKYSRRELDPDTEIASKKLVLADGLQDYSEYLLPRRKRDSFEPSGSYTGIWDNIFRETFFGRPSNIPTYSQDRTPSLFLPQIFGPSFHPVLPTVISNPWTGINVPKPRPRARYLASYKVPYSEKIGESVSPYLLNYLEGGTKEKDISNSILGSGNFDIIPGGTFRDNDEVLHGKSFYYRPPLKLQKSNRHKDFFENFHDFNEIYIKNKLLSESALNSERSEVLNHPDNTQQEVKTHVEDESSMPKDEMETAFR